MQLLFLEKATIVETIFCPELLREGVKKFL